MPRIDSILQNEMKQLQMFGEGFSKDMTANVLKGTTRRHERHRTLYQRQADLNVRFLEEMQATLSFLNSHAGEYKIADGRVVFQSQSDADLYNSHFSKLQALAAEQETLDQAFRQELEMSKDGFSKALTGTK